jgi:hypothetical protein
MSDRIRALRQKPDRALIDQLTPLIEKVVGEIDEGRDCCTDIAKINALCGGREYTQQRFFELYSAMSSERFAEIAAKGIPPILENLTRAELIEIIEIISDSREPPEYYVELLDKNLPEVWSSDLIFWPEQERSPSELADYLLDAINR